MSPPFFVLAWAASWAVARLLLGFLSKRVTPTSGLEIELDWWRVTIRHTGASGLAARLAGKHKRVLRRWFAAGAVAGLLAGAASVALLCSELWTLLQGLMMMPAPSTQAAVAAREMVPRLQLALPGVTLPASHAAPLWLALAVSLVLHEAGHALAAVAEGVHVAGAGLSLLLLVPAAFVELDDEDLSGLSRHSMLAVAAAGAWHNAVLAAASWAGVAALGHLAAAATATSSGASALAGAGAGAGAGLMQRLLLSPLRLLLGYTGSLSAALALLNMAPVWFLDGQQALEALLQRRPANSSPQQHSLPQHKGAAGGAATQGRPRQAAAVRWVLHAGTGLYATVLALHLLRMR